MLFNGRYAQKRTLDKVRQHVLKVTADATLSYNTSNQSSSSDVSVGSEGRPASEEAGAATPLRWTVSLPRCSKSRSFSKGANADLAAVELM